MKKLIRYLVNTILYILLWCIMFLPVMKYSIDSGSASAPAIGGIVALIVAYITVKRINNSKLWTKIFFISNSESDLSELKNIELEKVSSFLQNIKYSLNNKKLRFYFNKLIRYSVKKSLYFFLIVGIIYIIIPYKDFYNYHKTINLVLNKTHSLDDLVFIDNEYFTKKDMKKVKSGGFIGYAHMNDYYNNNVFYNNNIYLKIKNGKKHGKWWYSDGGKFVRYSEGIIDGNCASFFYNAFNGKNKDEVNFKNEKFHGIAKTWYDNGQLESEILFEDGKIKKVIGIWDQDANPLNFEFNMNKVFYAKDWYYFEANEMSKALLYAQQNLTHNSCPSTLVERYLDYDFDIKDHKVVELFFRSESNCHEHRRNFFRNTPVKINKKYDGKIDKLIYYNSNTKHAKWDHISRLNVKKSYIHILKQ